VRVTILDEDARKVTMKVEGKIAGVQVAELNRAWQELGPSLAGRTLSIDLRDVTHVDERGRELLADMHAQTGAAFLADTPLTKFFAEQAQEGPRTKPGKGKAPRRRS
jgi:ABC-type transporter Mla MlaB component